MEYKPSYHLFQIKTEHLNPEVRPLQSLWSLLQLVSHAVKTLCIFLFMATATVSTEVFILLARSLFPIHPIAAAMQSIGVCKRDLENDPKTRLGRIIAPAVLFHGLYDFSVVWLYYIGNRQGNYVDEDDGISFTTEEGVEKISGIVSTLILVFGWCYYTRESRKQRQRLAELDGDTAIEESSLT